MTPLPGLTQQVGRSARDHLAPMPEKRLKDFLEIQQARLSINKSHHINAEHRLHLGLSVEIVEHNIADFSAP